MDRPKIKPTPTPTSGSPVKDIPHVEAALGWILPVIIILAGALLGILLSVPR